MASTSTDYEMEAKKPLIGRLTVAGKWITVSVTTVAAIIGVLVNARNLGLTPWLNVGAISFADVAARRIMVSPSMDTLQSLGDTLHMAATVTDEHGATLAGATIVWSTDDSAVAIVDSSGGVISRGPGTATIEATVREHHARSRVTVWQRVKSVAISHDTLLRLPEGSSIQLVARALDAKGHAVRGRSVSWKSSDNNIVGVSEDGSAKAGSPGRTTLIAMADGYSTTLPAEVALSAASLKITSGDNQRAPTSAKLTDPVGVQVFSRSGRPVPDAVVTFTLDNGEGSVGSENVSTDRAGRARTTWKLGPHAGVQRLVVSVGGVDSSLSVVAEADPVASNTRVGAAGERLSGPAGALLPTPAGVHVTDASGAAVVNVPVSWSVLDGGKIEALSARTDSIGEAWANWTLGLRAGIQRVRVQVGSPRFMPAFVMTANAMAEASATSVALVSGANQSGRVGGALKLAVVAKLMDKNGNPVVGGSLKVVPFAGSVPDSAPAADARGLVTIHWTLGTRSGPQQLELAAGSGAPIRVLAKAVPMEPANVNPPVTPTTWPAGRPLGKPVTVTVTDAYGNAIPNVQVVFGVTAGSAAPLRVMTDLKGQAATKWMLGANAGDQVLTAVVKGTPAKTTLTVKAVKPTAPAKAPARK